MWSPFSGILRVVSHRDGEYNGVVVRLDGGHSGGVAVQWGQFLFRRWKDSGDSGGDGCTTVCILSATGCAPNVITVVNFMLRISCHTKEMQN